MATIESPIFQPALRIVTAISNSFPARITTSFAHDYITGAIVRFIIPKKYVMKQMHQKFGDIVVTGPNTFDVNIDTTKFDIFGLPNIIQKWENIILPWLGNESSWSGFSPAWNTLDLTWLGYIETWEPDPGGDPEDAKQQAQVIPIAEISSTLASATVNVL